MSKIYELYHCEYKGEIVYIGQGVRGRHRHCNSGCSHVYELNKIHFFEGEGSLTTTVLVQSKDKGEIAQREVEYIRTKSPRFNKVHLSSRRQESVQESIDFRKFLSRRGFESLKGKSLEKYEGIINSLMDYFGYKAVKTGDYLLEGKSVYQRLGNVVQVGEK